MVAARRINNDYAFRFQTDVEQLAFNPGVPLPLNYIQPFIGCLVYRLRQGLGVWHLKTQEPRALTGR